MKNIVICGNYGATNLGDEAILDGLCNIVKAFHKDSNIIVLAINSKNVESDHKFKSNLLFPAGIRSFIRNIFNGEIKKTIKTIRECDLFILGGGGLFTDEKFRAVIIWAIQALIAVYFRKPLLCLGQSVGPLRTAAGRFVTRKVFEKSKLTIVRDDYSRKILTELGIKKVVSLADCAFTLSVPQSSEENEEPFIVLSVRPWFSEDNKRSKILSRFIEYVYDVYKLRTVLVPFQIVRDNDHKLLSEIYDGVENKKCAEIFDYKTDYRKVLELIAKAKAVVGMRLHSLIFSSIASRPFVAISYSAKVTEFVKQMHMGNLLIDWTDLTLKDLQHKFDILMKDQESLIKTVEERTIIQRNNARQYIEELKKLDR
jgi:polysaccharide pyruvyl transferase CsaB